MTLSLSALESAVWHDRHRHGKFEHRRRQPRMPPARLRLSANDSDRTRKNDTGQLCRFAFDLRLRSKFPKHFNRGSSVLPSLYGSI